MITIDVKDFAGIHSATIALDRIAVIGGMNGAGKSSLLMGTASCVTNDPLAAGVLKKDAANLVHDKAGAKFGSVSVKTEEGLARMVYPTCEPYREGKVAQTSKIAAGLSSLIDMNDNDRAATLIRYMQSDVTAGEFVTECLKAKFDEKAIASLWNRITEAGWDGAISLFKADGAVHRKEWERLTGEKFGTDKGPKWLPLGWRDELKDADAAILQRIVGEAEDAWQMAKANQVVDTVKVEQLRIAAAKLPEAEQAVVMAQSVKTVTATNEEAARADLDNNPEPQEDPKADCVCPSCKTGLIIRRDAKDRSVVATEMTTKPLTPAQRKKAADAFTKAREAYATAQTAAATAAKTLTTAETDLTKAQNAKADLEIAEGKTGGVDPAVAKAALDQARADAKAADLKEKADTECAWIMFYIEAVKIAAPEGLRSEKMKDAIATFNQDHLAPLCSAANWPAVTLADHRFSFGGRPYALISESQKWRVRRILQLAMAKLDGSPMVIIDGADVLDTESRGGLVGALEHVGIPALVGMTFDEAESLPDLSGSGGSSYWVDAGTVRQVS